MPGPVLHVDLDAFLAAVEVLRHPELAGRPVVVGGRGDPTERGVVSTASYEARAFGVRSGMPLRVAARRCPEAVFLASDKPHYEAVSAEVMTVLRDTRWLNGPGQDGPVDVEVLGWDEAFVGLRTDAALADPEGLARHLQDRLLDATGLHCSVGIGDTTTQAKIATDFGKPRGVFRISDATWAEQMGHRPTSALWGVGPRTAAKLEDVGICTVAELAAADEAVLVDLLGPRTGPWYLGLGRGRGRRRVDPTPWVARAHGREETFQADLTDRVDVEAALGRLTAQALADIDAEGRPAVRVGLKIRVRPFLTRTRSLTLPAPSSDLVELTAAAVSLLDRLDPGDLVRPVRLLGVRLEMADPSG